MDNAECAARILARAFGYGQAWEARRTFGIDTWRPCASETEPELSFADVSDDGEPSAVSDGLPVCRETETLERTGESVSVWLGRPDAMDRQLTREQRKARAKLSPEERERLWAWERDNPLAEGQQRNPYRPRELEHWKRTKVGAGVQIMRPLNAMDTCALEALAGIPKPLQATLLVYALQDDRHWPAVETYARATLPASAHTGIPEGMFRLLVGASVDSRAKALRMRRADYVEMTTPALHLFEDWLQRASERFLAALDRPPPPAGSQGNAHSAETWWRPPCHPPLRVGPRTVRQRSGAAAHVPEGVIGRSKPRTPPGKRDPSPVRCRAKHRN